MNFDECYGGVTSGVGMIEAGASWAVEYADGSTYTRFTEQGENLWNAIDWTRVVRVAFVAADAEAEFDFQHPGDAYDVRLGSRVGMALEGNGVDAVRALMIVTHLKGEPITEASVKHVFFWLPDGTTHDCDRFNCPDVHEYLHALVHGLPGSLVPCHSSVAAHAAAVLV